MKAQGICKRCGKHRSLKGKGFCNNCYDLMRIPSAPSYDYRCVLSDETRSRLEARIAKA